MSWSNFREKTKHRKDVTLEDGVLTKYSKDKKSKYYLTDQY